MTDFQEAVPEELMLFELPPKDIAVESEQYETWKGVGQEGTNTDFREFRIHGNHGFYVDLESSMLKVWVRIVKSDGSRVTDEDMVTLSNMPLHTIWSQIDFYLGPQLISRGTYNHYHYKAYLDTLLFSNASTAELNAQGYYHETAWNMGQNDPSDTKGLLNDALDNRHELTSQGHSVAFEGPLFLDICRQKRFLPHKHGT